MVLQMFLVCTRILTNLYSETHYTINEQEIFTSGCASCSSDELLDRGSGAPAISCALRGLHCARQGISARQCFIVGPRDHNSFASSHPHPLRANVFILTVLESLS
jgi:hypothetical protein